MQCKYTFFLLRCFKKSLHCTKYPTAIMSYDRNDQMDLLFGFFSSIHPNIVNLIFSVVRHPTLRYFAFCSFSANRICNATCAMRDVMWERVHFYRDSNNNFLTFIICIRIFIKFFQECDGTSDAFKNVQHKEN